MGSHTIPKIDKDKLRVQYNRGSVSKTMGSSWIRTIRSARLAGEAAMHSMFPTKEVTRATRDELVKVAKGLLSADILDKKRGGKLTEKQVLRAEWKAKKAADAAKLKADKDASMTAALATPAKTPKIGVKK